MSYDVKTALYWRIEGLLKDAIYHEEQAKSAEDENMKSFHKRESASKFSQAEWAERRLNWLKLGGN
jgi:hypothetical protein